MTFNFTWGRKSIHIYYSASTSISLGNSVTHVESQDDLKFVLIRKAKDAFFCKHKQVRLPSPPRAVTHLMKREGVGLGGMGELGLQT